jgi:hypothetical protein
MSANIFSTAMKLTAQATTVSSGDCDNTAGSAAVFVIDITAITGTTPAVTFTVEGKDPISGKYYTILASASLTATGTTVLRVFPGVTAAANLSANDILPRTFRVTATISGTTPAVTATVGVLLNGF